ncbi:MAG: 30S ribosomal protein S20 [Oscillospiraceae bacterium]|jgi:small subunit ribosomal protein S20|nr:30S ribosomal protein S20 [Oscillospiraceae bacterium]
MPNIASAKKRVKVAAKKNLQNRIIKTNLKTVVKKVSLAAAEGLPDKEQKLRHAIKKIDQATKKGIIHRNCAARKKSQLVKLCK